MDDLILKTIAHYLDDDFRLEWRKDIAEFGRETNQVDVPYLIVGGVEVPLASWVRGMFGYLSAREVADMLRYYQRGIPLVVARKAAIGGNMNRQLRTTWPNHFQLERGVRESARQHGRTYPRGKWMTEWHYPKPKLPPYHRPAPRPIPPVPPGVKPPTFPVNPERTSPPPAPIKPKWADDVAREAGLPDLPEGYRWAFGKDHSPENLAIERKAPLGWYPLIVVPEDFPVRRRADGKGWEKVDNTGE